MKIQSLQTGLPFWYGNWKSHTTYIHGVHPWKGCECTYEAPFFWIRGEAGARCIPMTNVVSFEPMNEEAPKRGRPRRDDSSAHNNAQAQD